MPSDQGEPDNLDIPETRRCKRCDAPVSINRQEDREFCSDQCRLDYEDEHPSLCVWCDEPYPCKCERGGE